MKRFNGVFIFIVLLATLGCVTTKEYNARIADINGLKTNNAALEEKLKQTESDRDALSKELEDVKVKNQALLNENTDLSKVLKAKKDELSKTISDLRERIAEKDSDITALKKQINDLSQEKEQAVREKEKSVAELKKTYDSLIGEMNEEIKKGEISVTQLKDKLSVNLVEKILFDSGSADIKKDGKKVLERVAEILKKVTDKQVRVEGHTDNVPIGSRLAERFPSNWELSTARATTVARYLQDKGIDPKLLSAGGYSEYRPVAPNDTDENKAKNRRIEIALVPKDADRPTEAGAVK
jgi:chemotaxis protein MotB